MELWVAKTLSMLLLGGVSLSCGVAPLFLRRCLMSKWGQGGVTELLVSALACFGGGVVLTTCLTHMLPEVNLMLANNVAKGEMPNTGMPLAEILVLCGFFMIYIVEEVTHTILRRCSSHGDDDVKGKNKSAENGGHADRGCEDMLHHVEEEEQEHSFEATLRGFLVILALSLHAIFEGIALGLTSSVKSVWFIFFAIASHKFVISFCVGMQFVTSGVRPMVSVLYVFTFAIISPVGAAIGLLMSYNTTDPTLMNDPLAAEASLQNAAVTVLQGLATGTLLYVVFFEVIEKERSKGTNGMLQATFILLGFLCMVCLEYIEVSGSPTIQTNSIPNSNFLGSKPNWVCELEQVQDHWQYPVNLTCKAGKLIQ